MKARRELIAGLVWTSPWLVGSAVFLFLPMAMSFWYSLTDYPMLKPPVYIGLGNYRAMWGDERLWLVVRNTAMYAGVAIPLLTLVGLVLAAAIAGATERAGRWALAAVFLPTLVPAIAAAMIWYWLLNPDRGLVNLLLAPALRAVNGVTGLSLETPNWLGDAAWGLPAIVLTSLWGVGQAVVIYVAAIREVPRQLYEAASLDGMGPARRFWHVTVPMISPVILFNVITLTIAALQVFAIPYVLFRDERGQRDQGYFLSMYLYDNAFVWQKMGYASALAWIQLVFVLILTGVMFLASRRLVHYRAG